jgi:hypothetical protein
MPTAVRWLIDTVDTKIERFLLHRQSSGTRTQTFLVGLAVALSILLAGYFKSANGTFAAVDLFMVPVVAGCFFFRQHALLVVDAAILCDFLVSWQAEVGWGNMAWPSAKLAVEILLQGLELAVLGAFISITLDKWAALSTIQRRTEEDLELAKALQSSLINQSYALGRVAIEGSIHQCSAVGGDFFYFRPFEKKMVTFCLGDVMGKGISASLLMSMVMSFVYEWGKRSFDPAEVCGRLNRRLSRLWDGKKGWFLTIFYAIFDEETGKLSFCSAGQQGGFLLRPGAAPEQLNVCDPPVGVLDSFEFERHEISLCPGDRVVLFSDGVSEARSPSGELYGVERVARVLEGCRADTSGRELVNRLEQDVLAFTGGIYTDDTAILHFQYLSEPRLQSGA